MDFWGIDMYYEKISADKKQENVLEEYNKDNKFEKEESFEKSDKGFGCQTEGCGNREAKCGSVFLPYCNENLVCAKNNIAYLVEQNIEQRGKITVYHNLVTSIHPSEKLPCNFMDEGI